MRTRQDTEYIRLLISLADGTPRSVTELSRQLRLSEKQVRTRLDLLQEELSWRGLGEIRKKPRVGVWLEADEGQKARIRLWTGDACPEEEHLAGSDREGQVLYQLLSLNRKQGITGRQLMDQLHISAPTLNRLMQGVRQWLDLWNIDIISDRRQGYRLSYEEKDYRNALISFFLHSVEEDKREEALNCFFYGTDLSGIRNGIVKAEHEWHLHFSNQVFTEVLICLAVAMKRPGHPVILRQEDIRVLENYNEYLFAAAICSEIGRVENHVFAEEDILYLALRIMAAGFARISRQESSRQLWQAVRTYDAALLSFVDEVLETIGPILGVDLGQDKKLREGLVLHLRSTIFRMRHGQTRSNELLSYIKKEYSAVFTASWVISMLCEKYFDLQITDDELGYIVLLIQSALERQEKSLRVVLIADFPRSCGELISQRIMRYIPEIKQIDILSRFEHDNPHYRQADLILSRTASPDPRSILIENLLTDEGLAGLKGEIARKQKHGQQPPAVFSMQSASLFSPDLIFLKQRFGSKADLIRFVTGRLEAAGFCSPGLYESAINREKTTSTSIGSGIAFPHGDPEYVNESKAVIVTLEKPLQWDAQEKADIIFFAAFNMNAAKDRQQIAAFYKELIPYTSSRESLDFMRQQQDSIRLYQSLCA